MPLLDRLLGLRAEIRAAAAASGARDVRVFGSVARGEERPESDVDVLVDLDPGRTLFDLAALEERLERLLGRPVQVATARELRDPVRRAAERDAVRVT
ncbi:MAG TPA: nucleotidyltransferase family protein [Gemmatirosa sp.]